MPQASPGGASRRLSAWGIRKAVGRAGPPKDGPKLGAVFAPLGGACVYRLFIFGGRPKASSRRCKKEKVICQISSNSVWHFLRSAKKASLRPLRGGVSDGQGCRPGPANTGVPPATYGCSTAGLHPRPREGFALPAMA